MTHTYIIYMMPFLNCSLSVHSYHNSDQYANSIKHSSIVSTIPNQ